MAKPDLNNPYNPEKAKADWGRMRRKLRRTKLLNQLLAPVIVRYPVAWIVELVTRPVILRRVRKAATDNPDLACKIARERHKARWYHFRKRTVCASCGYRPQDLANFTRNNIFPRGHLCDECAATAGILAEQMFHAEMREEAL